MIKQIAVIVAMAALMMTAAIGMRAWDERSQRAALAVTEGRDARIMAWVVERNRHAEIADFQGFPQLLVDESRAAGIDFRIVLAIIDKESQFDPRAVGRAGEVGLMQVLPTTAALVAQQLQLAYEPPRGRWPRYESLGSLADPRFNVKVGVTVLRDALAKFGDAPSALRAYNRGDDRARQHWPEDRYAEDVGLRLVALVQAFPR